MQRNTGIDWRAYGITVLPKALPEPKPTIIEPSILPGPEPKKLPKVITKI